MSGSFWCRFWVLACFAGGALAVLPDWLVPCKGNDPNLNKCVTDTINRIKPELIRGIPLLGVPSVEPLKLENIRLLRGPAATKLDINITEILVSGPSTFDISNLKMDLKKNKFTYHLHFAELSFTGKYQMDGRVLLLPLKGEGPVSGSFQNYDSDVLMKGNKVKRDGKDYLMFEKMKLSIAVGKAQVRLENLFNGDPVLGPATNDVLNQNSDLFLDEIKPILEEALADLFTGVANKVTSYFTYQELFPES